jgi:4-hydroxybenzoate polyprenyltransferase
MEVFLKLYKLIRILSIDIVAGVVAGSIFAAHIMKTGLPLSYLVVISLTVWLIYMTDHLFDGIKKKGDSAYEVHRLFYKYRTPVILALLILVIFDFRLAMYTLPPAMIQFGLITGGATIFYLSFNFLWGKEPGLFFMKELWIAAIYTFAIWGGPVIYSGNSLHLWQVFIIISYGLLVLSNVLIYSYFEINEDKADGEHTFAVDFGQRTAMILIYILLAASALIWITDFLLLRELSIMKAMILFLMNSGLLFVILFADYLKKTSMYGALSDGVFLFPFLVLIGG